MIIYYYIITKKPSYHNNTYKHINHKKTLTSHQRMHARTNARTLPPTHARTQGPTQATTHSPTHAPKSEGRRKVLSFRGNTGINTTHTRHTHTHTHTHTRTCTPIQPPTHPPTHQPTNHPRPNAHLEDPVMMSNKRAGHGDNISMPAFKCTLKVHTYTHPLSFFHTQRHTLRTQ